MTIWNTTVSSEVRLLLHTSVNQPKFTSSDSSSGAGFVANSDHGPTAAGPMLGIRFRQEVSVDNKATCTSFGDENIFKAGGYRWLFVVCLWRVPVWIEKKKTRFWCWTRKISPHVAEEEQLPGVDRKTLHSLRSTWIASGVLGPTTNLGVRVESWG